MATGYDLKYRLLAADLVNFVTRQYYFSLSVSKRSWNRIRFYVSTGRKFCYCVIHSIQRMWESVNRVLWIYINENWFGFTYIYIWWKYWTTTTFLCADACVNTRLSSQKSRYFKQMFYWVRMTNTLKGRFIWWWRCECSIRCSVLFSALLSHSK